MNEAFQGSDQEGERSAQLMADVGEEAALGFIEFLELVMRFLNHAFVLVQFPAQFEFAKALFEMIEGAENDDRRRGGEKVEIIENRPDGLLFLHREGGSEVKTDHHQRRDQ